MNALQHMSPIELYLMSVIVSLVLTIGYILIKEIWRGEE